MQIDDDLVWRCQYCSVENTVWVDLTAGDMQDFIEDCRICCRPNRIIITIDSYDDENIFIESRISDE